MKNIRFGALSLIFTAMLLTSTVALFANHAQASSPWLGYVKPSFTDYAPSGMPDFDERQDAWGHGGFFTWCGPVAAADSLWWLDSEYESILNPIPVAPPTISDHFGLVPAFGPWDDHDPQNVAPLVAALASLMNTDGMHSGGDHSGTRFIDFVNGIQQYLNNQGMSRFFEVHTSPFPTFSWIDNEVEKCQDVELFLEFYQLVGGIWTNSSLGNPSLEAGHFVTCAGANATLSPNPNEVLISDPLQDAYEAGTAPRGGREPVAHPAGHGSAVHNDAQYVSQDAYQVTQWQGPPPGPHGVPEWELVGYLQTLGYPATWHAFINAAVATSPQQIAQWQGYVKSSFPDYAQSGMPDFDEKQDAWGPGAGTYTWCVPTAVANSLWWLDSKYESLLNPAPVPPPTISDHFNLVPAFGPWDDHDPRNVDPLVHNLAALMDTDGQTSHDGHIGTRWTDVQSGIQKYLIAQGVAALFEVHNNSFPTFTWIDNETEKCQDVELFLEFYQQIAPGVWSNSTMTIPSLENGHCVTSAGANATLNPGEVLISDPYQDAFEAGTAPGREPAIHAYPHANTDHNDTQHVSQDAYNITQWMGPGPGPYGPGQNVWELVGYLQTMPGFDATWHTFIRAAVATSPAGIHGVAVTNLTAYKKVIFQSFCGNVTTTIANNGNYSENVNVTIYANMTSISNTTAIGTFTNVPLSNGTSTNLTLTWNTTTFAKGNYTLVASADPVPGETNTADNNFTDSYVILPMIGDLTGGTSNVWDFVPDGKCDGKDVSTVAKCFGSYPGCPPPLIWNANCDITGSGSTLGVPDGKVDGKDVSLVAKHFGEPHP